MSTSYKKPSRSCRKTARDGARCARGVARVRRRGISVTFEHIIYIPAALLVGTIFGYTLGARAVRRELAQLRRRVKR